MISFKGILVQLWTQLLSIEWLSPGELCLSEFEFPKDRKGNKCWRCLWGLVGYYWPQSPDLPLFSRCLWTPVFEHFLDAPGSAEGRDLLFPTSLLLIPAGPPSFLLSRSRALFRCGPLPACFPPAVPRSQEMTSKATGLIFCAYQE